MIKLQRKNEKEDLRGKSEWRKYFRGKRKKITKEQRNRILQYAKERAKQAMDDLVLISKGLHYLTDSFVKEGKIEKAKKHRKETFPMPLTGTCFMHLLNEAKHHQSELQKLLKEKGKEVISDVRGYSISQLKMKRNGKVRRFTRAQVLH